LEKDIWEGFESREISRRGTETKKMLGIGHAKRKRGRGEPEQVKGLPSSSRHAKKKKMLNAGKKNKTGGGRHILRRLGEGSGK